MSTPSLEGHPRFWNVAGKPRTPLAVIATALTVVGVLVLLGRSLRNS